MIDFSQPQVDAALRLFDSLEKPRDILSVVSFFDKAMKTQDYIDLFEELDDLEQTKNFLQPEKRRQRYPPRHPQKTPEITHQFIAGQDDSAKNFEFTYRASRHEAGWLLDSLGEFYENRWISDVLRMIKGGKEASVYLCKSGARANAPYLAAKVYRPRQFRNLKNDQLYRLGRADLDESGNRIIEDGMLKALHHRTAYGEQIRHQSWIAYELQTLKILHAAGGDVPEPYEMANNAILMGYIGDVDFAAPTLNTVELQPEEVRPLYERVIRNIDLMLENDRIHADLSAFNILYWDGEITLIDFPQVVPPDGNPLAWRIFERDVTRICDYFMDQGLSLNPRKLAADLWTAHGHKMIREVHPSHLDPDKPEDRRIWERQR